jgi:hypothetical protein
MAISRKKSWAVPREGLEEVHEELVQAMHAISDAGYKLDALDGKINQRAFGKLDRLISKAGTEIYDAVRYASKQTKGEVLLRSAKRATPRRGRGVRDRRALVEQWMKDNEMDFDAWVRTPKEHAAKGYGSYPDAEFIIVSEGPFHMLMGGYYDTPEATRLANEFTELLDSLDLWYDQADGLTFIVMDKSKG